MPSHSATRPPSGAHSKVNDQNPSNETSFKKCPRAAKPASVFRHCKPREDGTFMNPARREGGKIGYQTRTSGQVRSGRSPSPSTHSNRVKPPLRPEEMSPNPEADPDSTRLSSISPDESWLNRLLLDQTSKGHTGILPSPLETIFENESDDAYFGPTSEETGKYFPACVQSPGDTGSASKSMYDDWDVPHGEYEDKKWGGLLHREEPSMADIAQSQAIEAARFLHLHNEEPWKTYP